MEANFISVTKLTVRETTILQRTLYYGMTVHILILYEDLYMHNIM